MEKVGLIARVAQRVGNKAEQVAKRAEFVVINNFGIKIPRLMMARKDTFTPARKNAEISKLTASTVFWGAIGKTANLVQKFAGKISK